MNQYELESHVAAILQGDWKVRKRLGYYFGLDKRMNRPIDLAKEAQRRMVFAKINTAANAGNGYAIAYLGMLYENGYGTVVKQDIQRGVGLYHTAAEKYNNAWGQLWYGMCLRDGVVVKGKTIVSIDVYRARTLFQLAADQGYAEAFSGLGRLYELMDRNEQAKKDLYRQAAQQGVPAVLNELCVNKGWGNPFEIYQPQNIDIICSYKANKEARTSGYVSGHNGQVTGQISTHHAIDSYTVTVKYTGPVNIGERLIVEDEIDNNVSQLLAKVKAPTKYKVASYACCLGGCIINMCFCGAPCTNICYQRQLSKEIDARYKIANGMFDVIWEEKVAKLIKVADERITQRIQQVNATPRPSAGPTLPQLAQAGGSVILTEAQFAQLLAAAQQPAQQQPVQPAPAAPSAASSSSGLGLFAGPQPYSPPRMAVSSIVNPNKELQYSSPMLPVLVNPSAPPLYADAVNGYHDRSFNGPVGRL